MKVRATLIELYKKVNPFKTTDEVFWNGENNNYSQEIEQVVGNSPTGSRAREMFGKFVYGNGIPDSENPELDKGLNLSEVAKAVIDDVVVQNGTFIHTSYKIEVDSKGEVIFLPDNPRSLDYHKCRISETDDEGFAGMVLYKNFNKLDKSLTTREKKEKKKYYPFNPLQSVIAAQINSDAEKAGYKGEDWAGKIKHYRGQVMYLNLTPKYRYAVSKFDSVFNDLDTEFRISVYLNSNVRGGFLGKTAVLTQGLDEEQTEQIQADIQKWIGEQGASGIYHLSVDMTDDLENVLKVVQVPSQFDHKQFESVTTALRRNILGAANNLPEGLAFSNEGALFQGSGESYIQLKKFYWEQCSWEREKVEEAFEKLGYKFTFKPLTEKPLADDRVTTE